MYIRFCAALALAATLAFGQNIDATRLRYTAPGGTQRSVSNKFQDSVSVKDFGAQGDGVTDDTAALNLALAAAHTTFFPDGTYLLSCDSTTNERNESGGILPQSNSTLYFGGNATLKCKPNVSGYYDAIRLYNVSNVWIYGGTLDGNRTNVTAPGGTQYGFGVSCNGCSNVWVYGTVAKNFWGDGFYIDKLWPSGQTASNVNFIGVIADNNRRNGLSLINVNGFRSSGSTYSNSNGTAPQGGVDIEPGFSSSSVSNIHFENDNYTGNAGRGIDFECPAGQGAIIDASVIGGKADSNAGEGVNIFGPACSNILVSKMASISNNGNCGLYALQTSDGQLAVDGNFFLGNVTNAAAADCPHANILIQGAASASVTNNIVRAGNNSHKPDNGIQLLANTGSNRITGNDLAGSAATVSDSAEFNTFSEAATDYYCANRLSSGMQTCTVNTLVVNNTATIGGTLTTNGGLTLGAGGENLNSQTITGAGTFSGLIQFSSLVNNTSGGYKFPDGTTQTSAGVQPSATVISVNTNVSSSGSKNQTFLASGNITVTLYAASAVPGGIVTVKKTDTNANSITILSLGGTMDGQTSITLARQFDSYTFLSDGTNWNLI